MLARVRPVRSYPLPAAEPPPVPVVNVVQSDSLVDCQLSVFNAPRKTDVTFDFDCVFGGESTNADIFDEVSAGVWSALDGYNVSMLAYGQTGAGKTHTMNGTPGDRGVIFRAVSLLFEKIEQRREEGIDCVVRTSMVEVYNEAIHDLMAPPTRVGFDLLVTHLPVQRVLVEALDASLADVVGAAVIDRIELFELGLVDSTDISDRMSEVLALWVVRLLARHHRHPSSKRRPWKRRWFRLCPPMRVHPSATELL